LNDGELQGFSVTNKDDLLCGCGFGDARAHSQLHKEPTKWFTEWDMISIKSELNKVSCFSIFLFCWRWDARKTLFLVKSQH